MLSSKGTDPDSIPRYGIPEQVYQSSDEPPTGACWNCGHKCEVKMKRLYHLFCVVERDNGDMMGEIRECDPNTRECKDWVDEH